MASEKKPRPRTRTTGGTSITINAGPAAARRNVPKPNAEAEQPEVAESTPSPGEPETIPGPPVHTKPKRFTLQPGQTARAEPLAATLFARFDPNRRNVQPAEFYHYSDAGLRRHGRI